MRIVVASCPRRQPIQQLWRRVHAENWPDCPLPVEMLSPEPDRGWNRNLLDFVERLNDDLVLLMLDDHFIAPGKNTENVRTAEHFMRDWSDVGMLKLQAGNAHPPEHAFPAWPILGQYDRQHHPFKRTNLVPTIFRRSFLVRLLNDVLARCGPDEDVGRLGAIHFEVYGTDVTASVHRYPERMLGIHRDPLNDWRGVSFIESLLSDGVREGKLKPQLNLNVEGIDGIEAFQCASS